MRHILISVLMSGLALPALAQSDAPVDQGRPNVPEFTPAFPQQTRAPAQDSNIALDVVEVAGGLSHPWGIALLPDGAMLVSERSGRLRVIGADGALRAAPVSGLPDILVERQGGLLDVEVGPDFAQTRQVYFTYSKPMPGGSSTAAARGTLSDDMGALSDVVDLFVQMPPSTNPMHYGSRIVLDGADIYVTTGEHFSERERVFAQDLDKTYGKVVRVTDAGAPAPGNPFAGQSGALAEIYTFGHRNVQGAALRPETGDLWTIEHGPAGGDELNLIAVGGNYGWPVVSYGENYSGSPVGMGRAAHAPLGFVEPQYYWDPVIAPGGMVFYRGALFPDWQGDLLIGSLNPGALVRLEMEGNLVIGEERLLTDLGRVRDVAVDADGALLLLIDAPDGSVMRISPAQ